MNDFPLKGVIGIIANHPNELDLALELRLNCVEIRADLLLDVGITIDQILELVRSTKSKQLASLLTLRHPTHGGKFFGTEEERIQINQAALDAGADIIDLEWATDSAEAMIQKKAPMVLSHHDFDGMPTHQELQEMTMKMGELEPCAIKVVPTASTLKHSFQMLDWVRDAKDGISRIGFAMGLQGTSSRILTTAFGAPISYASFGEAVAPGQLSMNELLELYQIQNLNQESRIYALAGDKVNNSPLLKTINAKFQKQQENAVCIPLETKDIDELIGVIENNRFAGVQLVPPLEEQFKKQGTHQESSVAPSLFQVLS